MVPIGAQKNNAGHDGTGEVLEQPEVVEVLDRRLVRESFAAISTPLIPIVVGAVADRSKPEGQNAKKVLTDLENYANLCGILFEPSETVKKELEAKKWKSPGRIPEDSSFIAEFCRANQLIWFQTNDPQGGKLFIDLPRRSCRTFVAIDPIFGGKQIERMVAAGELKESGADKFAAPGQEGNRLSILGDQGSQVLVEGHREFNKFVVRQLGLDPDKVVDQEDAAEAAKRVARNQAKDAKKQNGEPIFDQGELQVRVFRFQNAWVYDAKLSTGANRGIVEVDGIFDTFVKLARASTGQDYKGNGDERSVVPLPQGAKPFLDSMASKKVGRDLGRVGRDLASLDVPEQKNRIARESNLIARQAVWLADAVEAQVELARDSRSDRLRSKDQQFIASVYGFGGGASNASLIERVYSDPKALEIFAELQRRRQEFSAPPRVEKVAPIGVSSIDPVPSLGSSPRAAFDESRFGVRDTEGFTKADYLSEEKLRLKPGMITDPETNSIIVTERKSLMPAFERIHKSLDVAPKLIEISAAIIDMNADATFDWGADFGFTRIEQVAGGTRLSNRTIFNGGLLGRPDTAKGVSETPFQEGVLEDASFTPGNLLTKRSPNRIGSGALGIASQVVGPSYTFSARFQALEGSGAMKVLSRPSVIGIDGTRAILFENTANFIEAPGAVDADLYKVNTPFILEIEPTTGGVNGDEIILDIKIIDDSRVEGDTTFAKQPLVSESEIHTTAIVGAEESLLIGGRYRVEERRNEGRVPVLGRVPVVGLAFKDREVRRAKTQRLFLITPRIIDPKSLRPIPPHEH